MYNLFFKYSCVANKMNILYVLEIIVKITPEIINSMKYFNLISNLIMSMSTEFYISKKVCILSEHIFDEKNTDHISIFLLYFCLIY